MQIVISGKSAEQLKALSEERIELIKKPFSNLDQLTSYVNRIEDIEKSISDIVYAETRK